MRSWKRLALIAPIGALMLGLAAPAAADPGGAKWQRGDRAEARHDARWDDRRDGRVDWWDDRRDRRVDWWDDRRGRWEDRRDRRDDRWGDRDRRHDRDRDRGWERKTDRQAQQWARMAEDFRQRAHRLAQRGQYRAAAEMRQRAAYYQRLVDVAYGRDRRYGHRGDPRWGWRY